MQASRPFGGSPSAHMDLRQLLSASAMVALPPKPPPTGQPGQVSSAPMPVDRHKPERAAPCACIESPSIFAPRCEHSSCSAVARTSGLSIAVVTVARYMLISATQISRSMFSSSGATPDVSEPAAVPLGAAAPAAAVIVVVAGAPAAPVLGAVFVPAPGAPGAAPLGVASAPGVAPAPGMPPAATGTPPA